MKYILSIIMIVLAFCFGKAKAQKDSATIYLDGSYQVTEKEDAFYAKAVVHKNKLYYVTMFRITDGAIMYTGSYKDKQLLTGEGPFEFYTNNLLTMKGNYHDGRQVGTWKKWSTDSLLIDSVEFDANGATLAEVKFSYHINRKLWHYVLEGSDGQKISKGYDTSGALVSEGRFTNGDGETFFYYPNGKIKMHSVFKNNQRLSFDFFDEDGRKYTEKEYNELHKND